MNLCPYRILVTKNVNAFRAVDDAPCEGALGGITDKHDTALAMPEVTFQVVTNAAAGTHTGAGHDDGAAADLVDGHGIGGLAGEVQAGKLEWIVAFGKQAGGMFVIAFRVAAEDLGCGDRHGGVEKHLQEIGQDTLRLAGMQVEQEFLRALQGKGGYHDIAATLQCVVNGVIQFLDRGFELFVLAVAVGGFHHHHVGGGCLVRVAQDWPGTQSQVAGKQDATLCGTLADFQQHTGRSEDMSGIDKCGLQAGCQLQGLMVVRGTTKELECVQGIEGGI